MNARVYANRTTLELTSRLDGAPFAPPTLAQGQTVNLYLRLAEDVDDTSVLDRSTIDSAVARFGQIDAAPAQGSYELTISLSGTDATVSGLAYNATATAVQTAINAALDGVIASLHPCTVTDYLGHFRVVFADNTLAPTITCTDNALWPMSFVDVDQISWDEGNAYLLQLRQTPVAESTTITAVVPNAPTITRVQTGATTDGVAINEIQKLLIPANFAGGSFQIVRGGIKSEPIPVPVQNGTTTIPTALAPLADAGGSFDLTPIRDGFYIEFQGTMGGEAQDLMTITVFEAAPTEYLVQIDTDTDEFRTLMLGADADGEIEVPFNLRLDIEDTLDANTSVPVIWESEWTFRKRVSDDAHNVSAGLVWNQPRSRTDNLPHSTDSLLVGNRSIVKTIGDGSATSFTVNHNLLASPVTVTADAGTDAFTASAHGFQNGDPVTVASTTTVPGGLTEGTTYYVRAATTDTFQLATAAGGSAINLTSAGSGTITVALADGTAADAVFVQVWETGGTKAMVSPEDYTVTRPSNNSVTVSGFASTPTSGQYQVIVQTAGRPATYQGHTHTIAEVTGLQAALDALSARVTALEAAGPISLRAVAAGFGGTAQKPLPHFVFLFPTIGRSTIPLPTPGARLSAIDAARLPRIAPSLYPAVHDAAVSALPTVTEGGIRVPVEPTAGNVGEVYENQTADPVELAIGAGWTLQPGGFAATDGETWYPVERYAADESSYYPAHLARVLFEDMVQPGELPPGAEMELRFPIELSMLMANTPLHCAVVIETAQLTEDTTPGSPGSNLASQTWAAPHLEQKLIATAAPREYVFGYRVRRASNGDLTADRLAFGKWVATTAPAAAAFQIRARLIRIDMPNTVAAPEGLIAVAGGVPFASGVSPDNSSAVGYLTIRS